MNIFERWNNAWADDVNYNTNLGHTPSEKEWEEEQKHRRKSLEEPEKTFVRL
jgi:hypothetical protein